jgi:hypothetical protein
MTIRVVFASEVEATKVVGAPSREVKIGGGSAGFTGAGLGTRWSEMQLWSRMAARAPQALVSRVRFALTRNTVRRKVISNDRRRARIGLYGVGEQRLLLK